MSQFRADWQPAVIKDVTTGSSDKTITFPVKYLYQPYHIECTYTTNATAGNRRLKVEMQEADGTVIQRAVCGTQQAASLTYYYDFNCIFPDFTSVRTLHVHSPLFLAMAKGQQKLRVYDMNAVDAAGVGEDLLVKVTFLQKKVSL